MTLKQLLKKTKRVLKERKWIKGHAIDSHTGAVCLIGALHVAAGDEKLLLSTGGGFQLWDNDTKVNAEKLLSKIAQEKESLDISTYRPSFALNAAIYNDRPSTTKADVLALLDQAIAVAE